ncbi:MepB family protein, partial [Staphylococcus cohnii species complex 1638]
SYAFEQQRESKLIHFPTCWVSDSYAFEQQRESQQCTPVMKISIKRMITINNNSNSLFNKLKETKLAFSFEALNIENWNQAYEAINFMFNHVTFKSRLAKKTPKKHGYFVAIWRKNDQGNNVPFNYDEMEDKLVINILDGVKKGQFIFQKEILMRKNILSSEKQKGKMAFRVYPSWEKDLNKTAKLTQKWQLDYFVDLSYDVDEQKLIELYT